MADVTTCVADLSRHIRQKALLTLHKHASDLLTAALFHNSGALGQWFSMHIQL